MKPKILYILYTYNRAKILKLSIETLFNPNNTLWPTEMLVIDDGSDVEVKDALYGLSRNSKTFPIHYINFATNQGLGYNWQMAWQWAMEREYDFVVQLEADYVYRENAILEAVSVLEAKPLSCAVSMYSNPDFWNGKQNWLFNKVMVEDFGSDPAKREFLHTPFDLDTKIGKIQVQLTTNSCGSFIMSMNRVRYLLKKYPEMWEKCFERSFNKPYPNRRQSAGDGPISSGLSFYFYRDIEDRIKNGENINYNIEAPWLDISDFSISDHKNSQGANGKLPGYPEGTSFVSSPRWKDEYLTNNPRFI